MFLLEFRSIFMALSLLSLSSANAAPNSEPRALNLYITRLAEAYEFYSASHQFKDIQRLLVTPELFQEKDHTHTNSYSQISGWVNPEALEQTVNDLAAKSENFINQNINLHITSSIMAVNSKWSEEFRNLVLNSKVSIHSYTDGQINFTTLENKRKSMIRAEVPLISLLYFETYLRGIANLPLEESPDLGKWHYLTDLVHSAITAFESFTQRDPDKPFEVAKRLLLQNLMEHRDVLAAMFDQSSPLSHHEGAKSYINRNLKNLVAEIALLDHYVFSEKPAYQQDSAVFKKFLPFLEPDTNRDSWFPHFYSFDRAYLPIKQELLNTWAIRYKPPYELIGRSMAHSLSRFQLGDTLMLESIANPFDGGDPLGFRKTLLFMKVLH